MNEYIAIMARTISVLIIVLALVRLIGKKQLSQLTVVEYVVSVALGSLAGNLTINRSINFVQGTIAILIWAVTPILIGYIALKSLSFRKVVTSEPVIVIQNGNIIEKNMAKARYNIGDLLMQLREKDVFDLTEVEFAILEPNGKLSVLKKPQYAAVTPKDLKLATGYKGLMTDLIIDGEVLKSHLVMANRDEKWLLDQLRMKNINDVREVLFAGLKPDGQVYVSRKKSELS